jgi:hypothetical protein
MQDLKVGLIPSSYNNSIKVIGYCEFSDLEIIRLFNSKEYNKIWDMDGEFTIIYTNLEQTIIMTSLIGAIQYFYYFDGKHFSHSKNIIDIMINLDIELLWDWESLGDLCELENMTQNKTLHKNIKRIPAGTLLTYDGNLKLRSRKILDEFKITYTDPISSIEIFNNQTMKWIGQDPILSLSGGFDSRLILSSMLNQGIFPKVVTLGNSNNSDMQVAESIAKQYLLEHIKVQLVIEDLFENGEYIAYLTNGSKPCCHWHTFLYPKKAQVNKHQSFYVGTLGEFARSYYFDRGFCALLNDAFSSHAQYYFWKIKLAKHRTFFENELDLICDQLNQQISFSGIRERAKRNASMSSGDFLAGVTRYYLEQRVPNFYANGISMYNSSASWRSPFHNIKWLYQIWNLSDHWKLGSNWHRLAIYRNYPSLLEFPEEKGLHHNKLLKKAPLFYWLPVMQRHKYKTYDMSTSWYENSLVREFLIEHSTLIDDLVDRKLIDKVISEHTAQQNRTRAISFLMTIIFFKLALKNRIN